MARRRSYGPIDPSTLGPGYAPGGAMELADVMGYPDLRDKFGDMAHYGADFGTLLSALQGRAGIDQAAEEAAIKLLLGQEGHQTQQNVANTTAGASMYGSDQQLAGQREQAKALANTTAARNENALQRAAMETKQREQASIQAAQARIQAAMLGRQGTIDAAKIRNQGAMDVAAVKALPPEIAAPFAQEVVKWAGGDMNRAIAKWKEALNSRGYDPNTPMPGVR